MEPYFRTFRKGNRWHKFGTMEYMVDMELGTTFLQMHCYIMLLSH